MWLHGAVRRACLLFALALVAVLPVAAQQVGVPRVDSIVVEGNARLTSDQITSAAGIVLGTEVTYRDIQRAIRTLYGTGQFDDVSTEQRQSAEHLVLAFIVVERPVLRGWTLSGPDKISERDVRDRVTLIEGRALDRAALAHSSFAISPRRLLHGGSRDPGRFG